MRSAIIISLALNVALGCALLHRAAFPRLIPRLPRSEVGVPVSRGLRVVSRHNKSRAQSAASTPWQRLESADPARFLLNLRAIGCPEQTIRELLIFRISRDYRRKAMALEAQSARDWDYTHERKDWREVNRHQTELRDEMMGSIESLFGRPWRSLSSALLGWGEIPPLAGESLTVEKTKQLRELDERSVRWLTIWISSVREGCWMRGPRPVSGTAGTEAGRIERATFPFGVRELFLCSFRDLAVRAAIYPPAAQTEAEFRRIVDAAEAMGVASWRNAPAEADDSPSAREYREQWAALQQRIKEVLGEDRISQLQAEEHAQAELEANKQKVEQELEFKEKIVTLAAESGVSAEDAARFFERLKTSRDALSAKFDGIEQTLPGTPEQKAEKMKELVKAELEKMAVEELGEKGRAVVQKMAEKDGF